MVCEKCSKEIADDSDFCPYCGSPVDKKAISQPATTMVKKSIPKKTLYKIAVLAVMVFVIGVVVFCEVRISNAKQLYAQGSYWKAYMEIDNIPTLGRKELKRIRAAAYAATEYESYLTTKRIRLSSGSSKSKDAYQTAFWDLTFGLYIDKRTLDRGEVDGVEAEEYQKFVDLFYKELQNTFRMSKSEADKMYEFFLKADEIDDMKREAFKWLDNNFF